MRSKLCTLSLLGCTYFSWPSVKSTKHVEFRAFTGATMVSGFSLWPTRIHTVGPAIAKNSNVWALLSSNFCSCSYISSSSNCNILNTPPKESSQHVANDDHVSGDDNDAREVYDEEDMHIKELNINDEGVVQDVDAIMDILHGFGDVNRIEVKNKLEHCCIKVSGELVVAVLSRIRNYWEAAFTFFVWAGITQPGYTPTVREYHSMNEKV